MLIEQAVLKELIGTSGLTNLVGQRIYYVKAPQNVSNPYIIFSKIAAPREHDHDGASGLASARFQFSIFAQTYREVKLIAGQIQSALQAFKGTMGGDGGVSVNGCFYENEIDFWEEGIKLYHTDCSYLIWHNE